MREKQWKSHKHKKSEFMIHNMCICVVVVLGSVWWWWWWWYGRGVVRVMPQGDARQCMHTAWKISISNSTNRKNSTTVFQRKFTPIIAFGEDREKRQSNLQANAHGICDLIVSMHANSSISHSHIALYAKSAFV